MKTQYLSEKNLLHKIPGLTFWKDIKVVEIQEFK